MEDVPLSKMSQTQLVTRLRILHFLVEHGPANKYLIRKESGAGSQPTVLSAVNELERTGEIVSQETNVHARGNQPSKLYDLTVFGLANLITAIMDYSDAIIVGPVRYLKKIGDTSPPITVENTSELLDHIAKKYRGLMPEAFELWQALREVGLNRDKELAAFCHELLNEREHGELPNQKAVANFIRKQADILIGLEAPVIAFLHRGRYRPVPVKRLQRNPRLRKAAFEHLTSEVNHIRKQARDWLRLASEYEKLAKSFATTD